MPPRKDAAQPLLPTHVPCRPGRHPHQGASCCRLPCGLWWSAARGGRPSKRHGPALLAWRPRWVAAGACRRPRSRGKPVCTCAGGSGACASPCSRARGSAGCCSSRACGSRGRCRTAVAARGPGAASDPCCGGAPGCRACSRGRRGARPFRCRRVLCSGGGPSAHPAYGGCGGLVPQAVYLHQRHLVRGPIPAGVVAEWGAVVLLCLGHDPATRGERLRCSACFGALSSTHRPKPQALLLPT